MVLDGPPQKPAEAPPPAAKRGADFHLVLKIANEEEIKDFMARLPKGSRLLGLFDKDGKLLVRPGESSPPNRLEEPPPKHRPPAPPK